MDSRYTVTDSATIGHGRGNGVSSIPARLRHRQRHGSRFTRLRGSKNAYVLSVWTLAKKLNLLIQL